VIAVGVLTVYRTPGKTPGRGQNIFKCSYDQPPPPGKVCDIDVRQWNPCTYEENFGYHLQQPCIFIKLNKVRPDTVFGTLGNFFFI
jgi:sodium/potassium-transporting ATPase subunit beta